MTAIQKQSREHLDQSAFVAELARGRTDFTNVTFTERINVNQYTDAWRRIAPAELDLRACDLGPDFALGDLTLDDLCLDRASSAGKVCLYRMQINTLSGRCFRAQEWFSVVNGTIGGCDLNRGVFENGFVIKNTGVQTLILDGCRSTQTLLDYDNGLIEHVSMLGASLGRRTPTSLGELK